MYDMRQEQGVALYEQGAALHDLQQRVAGIEDELRDWRWYDLSEDWSGLLSFPRASFISFIS